MYVCRSAYLSSILDSLTSGDVRVLIKTLEEFSQLNKFSRVFPNAKSSEYFKFFDTVPYYDKLLDAFEERFGTDREEGLDFVRDYCNRHVHL